LYRLIEGAYAVRRKPVNGTESKSNSDRLLRNKDFISPLKELGLKANNYSVVASVYDMDIFEMKWTRWNFHTQSMERRQRPYT
jgi:hypothetical protein